jgi:signal transduction histidine kinase
VEEAVELLRFEIEQAGVVSHLVEAEQLPDAAADRDQLFQALVNLMRNAIHAMTRGGDLTLRLTGVPHGVEVAVSDTGLGMAPEVLAHVLEPFYTTKTDGSGLGLTIAAQIVRDHGGEIKIESREGVSTTVTMRLPAA